MLINYKGLPTRMCEEPKKTKKEFKFSVTSQLKFRHCIAVKQRLPLPLISLDICFSKFITYLYFYEVKVCGCF